MGKPDLNLSLVGQAAPSLGARTDLIIGSVTNALASAGNVYENCQNKTNAELDTLFGARSILRGAVKNYIDKNKQNSRLDVQTLEQDVAAVDATGSITTAGDATEDGTIQVSIVSEKDFVADIDILTGDDLDDVRGKITAAFATSVFSNIPVDVTTSATTGVNTITAIDAGTIGNGFAIKVVGNVAGLTFTVTGMASGATDPTYIAGDFPATTRYTGVLLPSWFSSSMIDVVTTILDARFNSNNKIMDGVAFLGMYDTYANLLTYVNGKNSKSLVVAGNKTAPATIPIPDVALKGSSIVYPADWSVASFMGVRSIRLTTDAPISEYVMASGLDNFGGIALASLPYFNTPLANVPVTKAVLLLEETEKSNLETAGFAVIDVNDAENAMITGAVPTTYKTDTIGNADLSFKYLNYVDTGSAIREYCFNAMKIDLAQQRLTDDTLVAGRNMQNTGSIEALFMKYYSYLASQVLAQGGGEITSQVSEKTIATLNLATRTVSLITEIPIVTQVGTVNWVIKQVFSID